MATGSLDEPWLVTAARLRASLVEAAAWVRTEREREHVSPVGKAAKGVRPSGKKSDRVNP